VSVRKAEWQMEDIMKGIILAITLLSGGATATNENVQEYARGAFNRIKEVMTEDHQDLMNYRIDLMQSYDFDNMTEEEIAAALTEIEE